RTMPRFGYQGRTGRAASRGAPAGNAQRARVQLLMMVEGGRLVTNKDTGGAASARPEILILGAGYGGLHLAQRLAPALRGQSESGAANDAPIVLVDRRTYHQLTTELPR